MWARLEYFQKDMESGIVFRYRGHDTRGQMVLVSDDALLHKAALA